MKLTKIAISLLLALVLCSSFSLKKGNKPVYAFGFSASFTDTVAYYTEIQLLDSVALDKNSFLPQREQYSYQLKNYLEYTKGEKNRTCMIYFSESQKDLKKDLNKLQTKYKKNKIKMQLIPLTEFTFKKPEQ